MKRKANWFSVPEAAMSLSRFYKSQKAFIPEKLVSPPSRNTEDKETASLSETAVERQSPDQEFTKSSIPSVIDQKITQTTEPPRETESPSQTTDLPADQPQRPAPDLDKIREAAFQKGLKQGLDQAELDYGTAVNALNQACELLNETRETILKNSKGEMLDLVIALSEKIIRHSINEQDETITATVRAAIDQAVKSSEFKLYLNPEDKEVIETRSPALISAISGLERIIIKPDPTIEKGGCKIESENCTVDATLASQFDVIRNSLKEL